jgi:hypothetical protein
MFASARLILFILEMIINFVFNAVMPTARSAFCFSATLHMVVVMTRYISSISKQTCDLGVGSSALWSSAAGENGCPVEFIRKSQRIC